MVVETVFGLWLLDRVGREVVRELKHVAKAKLAKRRDGRRFLVEVAAAAEDAFQSLAQGSGEGEPGPGPAENRPMAIPTTKAAATPAANPTHVPRPNRRGGRR